ncbi:MAG TPA: crosslink repair DNA glycosylase YcaQ family protein, partial [Acidimicrobiales bacterium]|nr:crosslink repair DNA glycosylase YcaQ family protein [Acidimicrobiales bacterium]
STTVAREEQMRHLLAGAAAALGVATVTDLARYCGVKQAAAAALVRDLGLVPVVVEGWRDPAWGTPAQLEAGTRGLRSRATLVSPFDSLTWDRDRTERVFDFHLRLEAYTPKHKRVHGYYSMPLVVGDSVVGRVDPGRDGTTFVAKGVHLEPGANSATFEGLARALWSAASWVGSDDVRVDWVTPDDAHDRVVDAMEAARR